MRIALVHEFLTQLGGAERVLQTFHELFPEAPVHTLVYNPETTKAVFAKWDIRTSFLQKLPGVKQDYKWYLALMPKAVESFNFEAYDLVLSDSSAFAKGVITRKPTMHICYCHTPTRYVWENLDEYVSNISYPSIVKYTVRPYLMYFLKGWDFVAAQRPDFYIANSQTVKERIKKYYNRDSEVIYPPVDTSFFTIAQGQKRGSYYFTASRLEPYKRIDLVIETFNLLKLPLKVAGQGTQLKKLKSLAGENIQFLGRVSDEELRNLYRGAKAFIFPALEDSGIMILESLACGTPVIGLGKGGTAEYVEDGKNGILFNSQTPEDLSAAVKRLEILDFHPQKLRKFALRFDKAVFKKKILEFLNENRH